jgi:bacillolysin
VSPAAGAAAVQASLTLLGRLGSGQADDAPGLRSIERDELGMLHVRFQQRSGGLPLWAEEVIVHLNPDLTVRDLTGELKRPQVRSLPSGSPGAARTWALERFKAEFGVAPHEARFETVLYPGEDGEYVVACHAELKRFDDPSHPAWLHYVLEASSGEVLLQYNEAEGVTGHATPVHHDGLAGDRWSPAPPSGTDAPGRGASLYSGVVSLDTHALASGSFVLRDLSRGGSATFNAGSAALRNPIFDDNNIWGEATDPRSHRGAVDAHYGMQMTWDFLRDVLSRSSIDGAGEGLISKVHVGRNQNGAFWTGTHAEFGDGNGSRFSPLTTLDTVAHELGHGLTGRTARLVYSGESGGLNEAMSDILGTGVEWYAAQQNPAVSFDWTLAEDAYTPSVAGDALRYMDDPRRDEYSIDHYSLYSTQTEVHGSSGIANNAFYLLAMGGTNRTSGLRVDQGMGIEPALKIFYRALAFYMTPSTTFAQARAATLRAAEDLYGAGSTAVESVGDAWTAVGVH